VDGVCTVFGDPHYRTYDGKFFSFQGPCKYLLSADCVGRTFSIRVTNDARNTKHSAWTKTISLRVRAKTVLNNIMKKNVKNYYGSIYSVRVLFFLTRRWVT